MARKNKVLGQERLNMWPLPGIKPILARLVFILSVNSIGVNIELVVDCKN